MRCQSDDDDEDEDEGEAASSWAGFFRSYMNKPVVCNQDCLFYYHVIRHFRLHMGVDAGGGRRSALSSARQAHHCHPGFLSSASSRQSGEDNGPSE